MFDKRLDKLHEYTMMNPFDDDTKEFRMYDSNIVPNIGFTIRDSSYETRG